MSSSLDFIYSHGEVFNWGKDMRTSVLQGEDSVGRGRWKDWRGDTRTKASGRGGVGCPDKEMTRIPRAVGLERKMKNENKRQWMGEGW